MSERYSRWLREDIWREIDHLRLELGEWREATRDASGIEAVQRELAGLREGVQEWRDAHGQFARTVPKRGAEGKGV
jgi:hypothetical protein